MNLARSCENNLYFLARHPMNTTVTFTLPSISTPQHTCHLENIQRSRTNKHNNLESFERICGWRIAGAVQCHIWPVAISALVIYDSCQNILNVSKIWNTLTAAMENRGLKWFSNKTSCFPPPTTSPRTIACTGGLMSINSLWWNAVALN